MLRKLPLEAHFYPCLFTEYKDNILPMKTAGLLQIPVSKFIHTSFGQRYKENYFQRDILEFKMLTSNPNIEKYIFKNPEAFSKYKYGVEKLYYV